MTKDGSTDWLMQGKNGELFRYGKDHCKDTKVWVKCDKDGNPLDKNGKTVDTFKEAKQYKRTEVADAALVKPLTSYFPNPIEMYAEGLMLYRLGNDRREELLRDSPTLYKAAKAGDQVEIDQRYGLDKSGAPRYIRGADGFLKTNDAANQKLVQEYESKIIEKQKAKEHEKPEEKSSKKQLSALSNSASEQLQQNPLRAALRFGFAF